MGNSANTYIRRLILPAMLLARTGIPQAEVCCEIPDAGRIDQIDTGHATVQEASVDLYVEKVWTARDSQGGLLRYSDLHILAKRPVDTSLFFQFVPSPDNPNSWITSLSYSAAGFPDSLIDSSWNADFVQGDTLRNIFAARITSTTQRTRMAFGGVHCNPLSKAPGPFPIKDALAALDRFRDSVAASKGQSGPPSHVKLGPIFNGIPGDQGLLVRAEASSGAWIVRYLVGSGDCPAGCTIHDETVFRVGPQGAVEVVSQQQLFVLCKPTDGIAPRFSRRNGFPVHSGCYTPEGRKLGAGGRPKAAVPWLEAPAITNNLR